MTKRLEMIFVNAAGRNTTIAVVDPRDGLTPAEVQAAMQAILDSNVFESTGGDLTAIVGARIVTRQVDDLLVA
ncbi:hypothetical protein SY88_17050 [Clostridiales bacterium PH28_bin88]|nr:hypothetical protein SY88_17050 [Clostridiales bacterium PH28_bin88]